MLQFNINRNLDLHDASLRRLLEAHVTYERMSAAKSFSLHLLAIVGVLIWVGEIWPSVLSSQLRVVVLALWGCLLVMAVCAGLEEWVWRRRVERYRREHQAKQSGHALG